MSSKPRRIFIGFDPGEVPAYAVARYSCRRRLTQPIPVNGLVLRQLQEAGLYTRPMEWREVNGHKVRWDVISDAPMSTEHANARFLVPYITPGGWVLFCDGDTLFRANAARLFDDLDDYYAVYCVKHDHRPKGESKKGGEVQTRYSRKNWTSVIAFNVDHPANRALTVEMVNTLPGRDLHRLCWLPDELIGELHPAWNYLVGYTDQSIDPKIVHFTEGVPDRPGFENVEYADEWRNEQLAWSL